MVDNSLQTISFGRTVLAYGIAIQSPLHSARYIIYILADNNLKCLTSIDPMMHAFVQPVLNPEDFTTVALPHNSPIVLIIWECTHPS